MDLSAVFEKGMQWDAQKQTDFEYVTLSKVGDETGRKHIHINIW